MSVRPNEINLQVRQLLDAAVLVVLLLASHWIRTRASSPLGIPEIPLFDAFSWLIILLFPFAPLILELHGFYDRLLQKTWQQSLSQILRSMLWLGFLVGACTMFLRLGLPSRAVVLIFFPIATMALLGLDRLYVWILRRRAKEGRLRERVILAGAASELIALEASLSREQGVMLEICDRHDIETEPVGDLVKSMHNHSVSRVIFAGGRSQLNTIEEAIRACDVEGVEAWLMADFIETTVSRPLWGNLDGRPVLVFSSQPEAAWGMWTKRVMDFCGALAGLVLLSPLFLAVAIAIRAGSPGPVFFHQRRGGKHGYPFTMLKFRTMDVDAEARRESLMDRNEMSGPVFKVSDDPRVTSIGRWLRRTSIDELPQLVNVLRGEMSLVGPRPLPLYEVEKFEDLAHRRRLSVKPGMTCLWQVSGRNEVCDFKEWVRLDLEYIDSWSLWLDIKILFRTVPIVLFGRGAK